MYFLGLTDKQLHLFHKLRDVGRAAEFDGLNVGLFKLCTEYFTGFDLKDRITNYYQISDGLKICHINTSFKKGMYLPHLLVIWIKLFELRPR